jgi:prevent-host-death family protein
MQTVSLFEAKTNLSKIVESLIDGTEQEIVISRRGKPVVRLTPMNDRTDTTKRIGIAKNRFVIPDNIDKSNDQIRKLFSA